MLSIVLNDENETTVTALDVKAARLAGETIIGDAEEAGYVSEELVADICDEDDNIIGHVQRAKMGTGFIYVH
jgi:hypothetical protein